MNSYIAETMRRLWAPRHELSCSRTLWVRLLAALRQRGERGTRESGAFLLGLRATRRPRILDFVLYDDLDPHCLDKGIVRFDGRQFGVLWDACEQRGLTVVADVHTHPGGSGQSASDRAHPMIVRAGHVSMIVPRFAAPPVRRPEIGLYRYLGAQRWDTIAIHRRSAFFHIGL